MGEDELVSGPVLAIFLVAGAVLLVWGLDEWLGPVMCEGQEMGAGDRCDHYKNGALVNTNTYQEEQSNQEATAMILMGLAAVFLFLGSLTGIQMLRRKAR